MLEKYNITQQQADKLATSKQDMFLITCNNVFQFVWSNAQGKATLQQLTANGAYKNLCKRGQHIIADAKTVNATTKNKTVWEN